MSVFYGEEIVVPSFRSLCSHLCTPLAPGTLRVQKTGAGGAEQPFAIALAKPQGDSPCSNLADLAALYACCSLGDLCPDVKNSGFIKSLVKASEASVFVPASLKTG
jgi:hypothetical protein